MGRKEEEGPCIGTTSSTVHVVIHVGHTVESMGPTASCMLTRIPLLSPSLLRDFHHTKLIV